MASKVAPEERSPWELVCDEIARDRVLAASRKTIRKIILERGQPSSTSTSPDT